MSLFDSPVAQFQSSGQAVEYPASPPNVKPTNLTERVMQQQQRIESLERQLAEIRDALIKLANACAGQLGLQVD